MKKCDLCGKRAEGLGTYPTKFQEVVLCSDCYENNNALRQSRKCNQSEKLKQLKQECDNFMKDEHYPESVVMSIDAWYEARCMELENHEKACLVADDEDTYMMTSGYNFEGYRIVRYHGVICGESVLGTGFLSSWNASWSDTFGVESESFMNKLKEARLAARKRAVKSMLESGGNAIIGVDIDYTMFSSNLIGVIFNGTSVTIEKEDHDQKVK